MTRTRKEVSLPRGAGTVNQLPSGRWRARVPVRNAKQVTLGIYETKTAAQEALLDHLGDTRRGDAVEPSSVTFGEFAADWLIARDKDLQAGRLKPRTVEGYEGAIRNQMLPHLEVTRLQSLDYLTIENWYREVGTETGPSQQAKAYRVMHKMLNDAVRQGRIRANPCLVPGAGVDDSAPREIPSVDQVWELIATIDPELRAAVVLAAFGGLRLGEILALTVRDVAEEGSVIHVRRGASELASGERYVDSPKSRASYRKVTIVEPVRPFIADHLQRAPSAPNTVLFRGQGGVPLTRKRFYARWGAAVAALDGLPEGMHFHDLRHFHGTWAAQGGSSQADVKKRLGQSTDRAVQIYVHATSDGETKINRRFEELLAGRDASSVLGNGHAPRATPKPAGASKAGRKHKLVRPRHLIQPVDLS